MDTEGRRRPGFSSSAPRPCTTATSREVTIDADADRASDAGVRGARPWTLVTLATALLLVAFVVVEQADISLLVDPRPWLGTATVAPAAIGVALLVADAVVPVPSSVVMAALGATYGVGGGFVLSVAGSVGGFALGYVIGRGLGRAEQVGGDGRGHDASDLFVRRWGVLAVVVSRPVPLVAEAVAVTCGVFRMRPATALSAAFVGSAVPAAVFAYAGWRGVTTADGAVVAVIVAILAAGAWWLGRALVAGDASGPAA